MQTSDRGRKLHILSAQRTDAARFTCVAKNPAGETRKNFDLTVQSSLHSKFLTIDLKFSPTSNFGFA